jgi:sulfide dehydrogenase cytochrome subunit
MRARLMYIRLPDRIRGDGMCRFAPLLALCLAGSINAQAQDADLARNLAAQCASCHAPGGKEPVGGMAALAGRGKSEIIGLMNDFKSGKRTGAEGTVMPQLAKGYSDAQIALIADYLARQKPVP